MKHRVGDWVICTVPAQILEIETDPDSWKSGWSLKFSSSVDSEVSSLRLDVTDRDLIPVTDFNKYQIQLLMQENEIIISQYPLGTAVKCQGGKSKIVGYFLEEGQLVVRIEHLTGPKNFSTLPYNTPFELWDDRKELQEQLEAELAALEEQQESIAIKQDKIREIQAELAALQGK